MRKHSGTRAVVFVALAVMAAGLVASVSSAPVAADGGESPGNPAFRSLSAGGEFTCAIAQDSKVRCWGKNDFGQLGIGDTANRGDNPGEMGNALPVVNLGTGRTATAISAGGAHACALLDNGTVKCWGANTHGQLGLGDNIARGFTAGQMGDNLPAVNLGTGRTAVAISAGGADTCAVLDNATLKCWGFNSDGQLGQGDTADRGDNAGEMGDNLPAVSLGAGRTVTAVSFGSSFVCAILDNGTVKCWGFNPSGQLGQGDTASRGDNAGEMGDSLPVVALGTGRTATALSTANAQTCAVLDNATLKCWGSSSSGQLGQGDTVTRGDNAGEMGNSLPAISLGSGRTVTGVSAGDNYTCARLDNATMKCWGANFLGHLGLGDTAARGDNAGEMGDSLPAVSLGTGRTVTAIATGSGHTCASLDDATVKCWGFNTSGEEGLGDTANRGDNAGEMGDSLPIVAFASRRVVVLSAGVSHACAVLDNGTLKCWGFNGVGQLGLGDIADRGDGPGEMNDALPAVSLGTGRTATAVAAGNNFTCALLDNGSVKCWGQNDQGQLGLGDTANRGDNAGEMGDALPVVALGTGRTAIALGAGAKHACAVLDNGTLKCWGSNASGQLGLGDVANRGDNPAEMGNSLPTVSLGTGRTATAVDAGDSHTCVRLDNATVKCWGLNDQGQLGLGDTLNRGDNGGEMGDSLPTVALGTGRTAIAITLGDFHSCARLDNAIVKCWGDNFSGVLGLGDTADRGDNGGEMGDFLPAVSLGTGRTVSAVSAGTAHTCARLDNGTVKCWGRGQNGRLGLGDQTSRGDGPGEMGDSLPAASLGTGRTAVSVITGGTFTCAPLDNSTLKCWGSSGHGVLGQGDVDSRGDDPGEMGDSLPVVPLGSAQPQGISGTVVDAVSSAPVPGAFVAILRSSDFTIAGGEVADSAGDYAADLPVGSYYEYLIDPAANHTPGFPAGNPLRTVTVDAFTDADPTMAPARGAVGGTVKETGPNTAIAGAFAIALNGATGVPERGVVANGSGAFTLPNLNTGTHFIGYIDPSGNHQTRFFPNSVDVGGASTVAVTAGNTTTANGTIPTQTTTGTGANLTGTITETGTGTPLANTMVMALHAADFRLARATVTNAAGQYTLAVTAGPYKLAFLDATGLHNMEWHNNQPLTGLATATSVTAPTVTNADLSRTTGALSGTITDANTNAALAGAWALAIGPTGNVTGGAVTAGNGTYAIAGLTPGTYRVTFLDPNGGRAQEYWDNSPTYAGAGTLNVTAGNTINGVDAALG